MGSLTITARLALCVLVALLMGVAPALAQADAPRPLFPSDFAPATLQGFGDRHNSHTWSMAWFQDRLFVGTGRATACVQQASLAYFRPDLGTYPPSEEDLECTPDPNDLPLQAQIWRWTPATDTWDLLYESPNDVPILGTEKLTARDIGFRGMTVFAESQPGGLTKDVLYVSGVSSRGANGTGFNGPLPPPRILRSEDGENFAPIPQDPGTFLGDTVISGFRTMLTYKGRLYVVGSLGLLGHGVILESSTPWLGNDAFREVSPAGKTFFEIGTYNGFLYAGTGTQPLNEETPFSLMKTDATGDLPYSFQMVIPEGAYKTVSPSAAVISLFVHRGRLYTGTDRELFRVNPDDTWEMVVGTPRETPIGFLAPLSGMDFGFDNFFNIHMWRMISDQGWLYVGTQDQSTKWRNNPFAGPILAPRFGFDLYATDNGWHFTPISITGFDDLFNNGVRNLQITPHGLFLGTANHYYGTQLHRGILDPAAPLPPRRLEVESGDMRAIFSWEGADYATRFRVFRATGFGAFEEIAVTDALTPEGRVHRDDTRQMIAPFGFAVFRTSYYLVVAEDDWGNLSGPSNIVRLPFKGPVPSFAMMSGLMVAKGAPEVYVGQLKDAAVSVRRGNFDEALTQIAQLQAELSSPPPGVPALPFWVAEDLDVMLEKLARRVTLARLGLVRGRALLH